ncbi:lysozyme inhibitor LprI family protein [Burkholderia ubonensis]|uniref:lysozyme inhibitor LprI family protein n=1 Tax=Burkholderia ubonensis TaxID=101571 RepID=UPI0009B4A2C7|nr:lysozyme inhibitor LprI family protein [Burkholderia ubonensis]
MHAIRWVGLGLMLSLPLLSIAAPGNIVKSEKDLYEECGAYSQAGMKDCLVRKVDESRVSLKKAEMDVIAVIKKWDEDNKYIRASQATLAASNKEFVKYREAQCEFSASLSGGGAGNAHEMGRLACIAELNTRRVEQLRNAVSGLPLK